MQKFYINILILLYISVCVCVMVCVCVRKPSRYRLKKIYTKKFIKVIVYIQKIRCFMMHGSLDKTCLDLIIQKLNILL